MMSPQWLRSDAPLILACLERRGQSSNLFEKACTAFEAHRATNYQLATANAALKVARKEKASDRAAALRDEIKELKTAIADLQCQLDDALQLLPNLLHISTPVDQSCAIPLLNVIFKPREALASLHDFLLMRGMTISTLPLIKGTFQKKDLPLFYLDENVLISIVAPDSGWSETDRHLTIASEFLSARSDVSAERVCANKVHHDAAEEIRLSAGADTICTIMNCTDFISRRLELKLAKSTSLSKSIHDNGFCWLVKSEYNL